MPNTDTINAYILDEQIKLFEDAKAELQISFAEIARRAGLIDANGNPSGTLKAWVEGRNALSVLGIKKLLRVKGNDGAPRVLAPYLSRLFEPEECALVGISAFDLDDTAAKCIDFASEYAKARHPESESGIELSANERRVLGHKATALRSVGGVSLAKLKAA